MTVLGSVGYFHLVISTAGRNLYYKTVNPINPAHPEINKMAKILAIAISHGQTIHGLYSYQ